jgi:alpha-galactosidase
MERSKRLASLHVSILSYFMIALPGGSFAAWITQQTFNQIKLMLNRLLQALIVIALFAPQHSKANTRIISHCATKTSGSTLQGDLQIRYGSSGIVSYSLRSGTFQVSAHGKKVLESIESIVKVNGKGISSKDYTSRTYSQADIKDGFGKGKQYTVVLTGPGLVKMQQRISAYPALEYFILEVEMIGSDLKTNYMVVAKGNFAPIKGDARSLFVPFDNDTFISYDAKDFRTASDYVSAEVGAVYDNDSRVGIVAGSVEHGVWKTGVRTQRAEGDINELTVWGGYSDEKVTRDKIEHGYISGNSVKSPKVFLGYFSDWRSGLEQYGKANRIADPPYIFNWTKPTPVGWNSWGVMQDKLTYDKAIKVVDFFADSLTAFRSGGTAYIDLDSYWNEMVKGDDYSTLKKFADYCKSKGLQPGIYWGPFTDWGHQGGPNRKVEGTDFTFGEVWTKAGDGYHDIDGARAIDPTHPGTRQRIAHLAPILKACGFTMVKIDFLGHAAAESSHFYDTTVTTGMQAYRKGMEYLIDQLGSQMLVYAAISPSLATGRYAHSRRIACDAFKTIDQTRYTLNSVNYGWWQSYLYNFIDADHVVFNDQPIGANRARMLSSIITGTLITGDDFSQNGSWSAKARQFYQKTDLLEIVKNGKAFRPVDGNTGQSASEMFVQQIGGSYYLAVFNYGKVAKSYAVNFNRIGIGSKSTFTARELLQGSSVRAIGTLNIQLNGSDAALYKLTAN